MRRRHLFTAPALGLGVFLASPFTPAMAAGGAGADDAAVPASRLQVAFTIYGGGIPFGKMDLDATLRGADYHAVANFQTSGVVSVFWQSEIQATSSGRIAPKGSTPGMAPALYDSFDIGHAGKKQEVSLTYDGAGQPRLYADPVYSTTEYAVKPEDQKNTLDPLSAVMFIVTGAGADAANPCGLTAPVFDGRRRYDITMTKVKDTDIKMDNGLYTGHALLCQAKYRQLAGYKPNVLKAREAFPAINAWVVSFPSAVAGRAYVVPVRVWADTPLGQVSVVASSLKIDGQAPK